MIETIIMGFSILTILIMFYWIKEMLQKEKIFTGRTFLASTLMAVAIVNLFFLFLIPYRTQTTITHYNQLKSNYIIYSASPKYQKLSDIEKAEIMSELLTYQNSLKEYLRVYKIGKFYQAYIPKEIEQVEFVK